MKHLDRHVLERENNRVILLKIEGLTIVLISADASILSYAISVLDKGTLGETVSSA